LANNQTTGQNPNASGRGAHKKVREWLLAFALCIVAVEVALQLAVRTGVVHFSLPSYSATNVKPFWQILNRDFGVWHPANGRYHHSKVCFDVTYTANSHGMRDREVPVASDLPRVVVLGDSFVEGWGVKHGHRFTEYLEQLTGIQHLNFGTSGGFGSTQSYMLYKTLASKFDHQAVIFSILPDNDFTEDQPAKSGAPAAGPYRPFFVGEYPTYEVRYAADNSWNRWLKQMPIEPFLNEFWLTFRARYEISGLLKDRAAAIAQGSGGRPSQAAFGGIARYFDYERDEFNRLRFAIEQIKAIAGDRPMLIFTIPRPRDFWRAAALGEVPPLRREIEALSAKLGITYIDLLEGMQGRDWKQYFLTCDGHWSRDGHEAAATLLGNWGFFKSAR
jgi:hypothetical protein